jgi:hypothetical protein
MDLNQTNEPRFTDEEMAEMDRLQSDPSSEYYYNDPDEGFLDKVKRKLEPYGEDFKGFIEYLFTPSRHFGTGQYNEGGVAEQMDMFGYTAEGAQQEADKFVGEAGNLEEDISKAASFIVPFYDSGVNIANVAQEYMKPEQERDYDYIKSQFTEAGQSAAIEGGLLLMGGVAGKYGAKGIKALADKVKQYEIDPTAMSAFGAGAIRKKPSLTLDDFGYKEDNPVTKGFGGSEDWLSGKIEQANKSKNLLDGATTAFLGTNKDKPLFLDTDFISSLKGARGEVRKKGEPQYDRLKKTVDEEGFDPNKTILIEVNHKGEAYIIEGNTRAALAKELGVPNIKAEIRYKNGAELVDSPFSPQNILEKSSTGSYQDALALSKKLDKEMISVFPKPERMFPEESRPKGGDYLNPATGEVLSGRNVSSAKLSISPEGRPSFKVSNDNVEEVGSVGKGKTQIKTNLFKKKAGWKWTKAPEGMEDIATLISVENKGKHFYTIETDFSKGVNLKKYPNSKTEPRLRPTVVGEIEIGPQIGTISVRGKEHPVYQNIRTFNKGGAVMEDQMEMAFMQEGGIADDGMDVDPVSGNEVPPGSLAEEVRDDIPAQLSEGEYVVPADVVRYYGVKFFEDLRDQAKMGLAEMEANGRIGGEPVPAGGPVNDQELSPQEMQAIQEMMGMAEGGEVQNPYLQQQQLYSQPRPAPIDEKRNTTLTNINPNPVQNQMPMQSMASGGQVQGYQSGNPVTEAPTYAQNTFNPFQYGAGFSFMPSTPGAGTPGTGTSLTPTITPVTGEPTMLTLYGPNGEIRTFSLPLSEADAAEVKRLKEEEGYSETKAVTTTPVTGGGGSSSKPPVETDPNKWMEKFDYNDMDDLGSRTSDMLDKKPIGGSMGLLMNAGTAAQAAANIIIMKNNKASEVKIAEAQSKYDQFVDKYLKFAPKGLINGDRLAKDIVLNNPGKDIGLKRDAVDLNNKPLFKDNNAFNKFMEKVGPEGMKFDPTEGSYKKKKDRDIGKILGGKKVETTPAGVDVYTPTTSTPRPKTRPSALVKTRTDSTGKKAGDVGYESALRKRQADKRKKYQKTQREKMKAFKKREQKTGVGGVNIGGRAEGGLMNKKGNK